MKRHKLLKITHKDIARTRGVTIHAINRAIQRKQLNPADLLSVAQYIMNPRKRRNHK